MKIFIYAFIATSIFSFEAYACQQGEDYNSDYKIEALAAKSDYIIIAHKSSKEPVTEDWKYVYMNIDTVVKGKISEKTILVKESGDMCSTNDFFYYGDRRMIFLDNDDAIIPGLEHLVAGKKTYKTADYFSGGGSTKAIFTDYDNKKYIIESHSDEKLIPLDEIRKKYGN